MSYTKGPWTLEQIDGSDIHYLYGSEKLFGYSEQEICMFFLMHKEEQRANASLVAAAPELLEALEAVVRIADRATEEFDMARAAIAKAKGEVK